MGAVDAARGCVLHDGGHTHRTPGCGATRRYSTDLQTAVAATRNALIGSALDIDDVEPVDDQTWMFLAKRTTSTWSHGELIRVIVQQTGADCDGAGVEQAPGCGGVHGSE